MAVFRCAWRDVAFVVNGTLLAEPLPIRKSISVKNAQPKVAGAARKVCRPRVIPSSLGYRVPTKNDALSSANPSEAAHSARSVT